MATGDRVVCFVSDWSIDCATRICKQLFDLKTGSLHTLRGGCEEVLGGNSGRGRILDEYIFLLCCVANHRTLRKYYECIKGENDANVRWRWPVDDLSVCTR